MIFRHRNIIVVLFGFLLILIVGFKKINDFGDYYPTVIVTNNQFDSKQNKQLLNGETIKQEFKSKYNNLGIISIKFDTNYKINKDILQFSIKEVNSDNWYYKNKYSVEEFQNNKYYSFGFPEIEGSKDKKYQVEITSLKGINGESVSVVMNDSYLLTRYSFPKAYLLQNKNKIPQFFFDKAKSFFDNIGYKNYVYILILSLILWLVLTNKNIKSIIFLNKKHIFEYIFLLVSFVIFVFLLLNPQKLVYDAAGYYNLGQNIYNNNFNIINTNLSVRTYGFPLFISFLIFLSNLLKLNPLSFIYFGNYLVFVLSIFFIYKAIALKNTKIANVFLLINSLNIINLSFTNTILTESFMVLPIAILFYFFSLKKFNRLNLFLIGIVLSFSVMVRPSNLFLFLICTIFVVIQIRENILKIIWFLIPVLLIFLVSFLNVYKNENKFSIFTTQTKGIYDLQIIAGVNLFKFETSVNPELPVFASYQNKQVSNLSILKCESAFNCLILYFKKDPIKYVSILGIHSFVLFDRNYISTYVENIYKIDNLLIIYNYIVLSSVVCFFIFFIKKYIIKYREILFSIIILICGTILIYIPTMIESRFSAPIFPLITIFSAIYFYSLFKEKKENKIKIVCCQLLIIFIFLIISYLVFQTMSLKNSFF